MALPTSLVAPFFVAVHRIGIPLLARIGYGKQAPQAIQMIVVVKPFGTLVIHALTPPQQGILKELGMPMRY